MLQHATDLQSLLTWTADTARYTLPVVIPPALTLRFTLTLDGGQLGALVTLRHADGRALVQLSTREAGDDPARAEWDRRQGYAHYPEADGRLRVLECAITSEPPHAKIAASAQPNPAMVAGRQYLGVPWACLGAGTHTVEVRTTPAHLLLLVDGNIVDEEWPTGPLDAVERGALTIHAPQQVTDLALFSGAEDRWMQPRRPLTQYWTPEGHNCWAGDTMLTADGDRLHLFWLIDRRMHASKYRTGGHQFAHASTTDLRQWAHHPMALPITAPWEAQGTACVVPHDGKYYLFNSGLTERLALEDRYPSCTYLSVSEDGLTYQKQGPLAMKGEPGIIRAADGLFHAISSHQHPDGLWRCTRYTSPDLRQWEIADLDFLPPPAWPCSRTVYSAECFNWFRLGDWWYILGGRTGFWRAPALLGPYESVDASPTAPRWDVYDGLMVPQVAAYQGRGILAGWLPFNDSDFAGHLVFRELVPLPDGNLHLRRLPELEPATGQLLQLAHADGTPLAEKITLDGRTGLRSLDLRYPGGNARLRLRITGGTGVFGLRLGGHSGDDHGAELRFEPATRRVQWGTPLPGQLAAAATDMPFNGGDFAMLGVDGLDQPITLDIILRYDAESDSYLFDAMLDERRTLITRRHRATLGECAFFAAGGVVEVTGITVYG